ncbi:hypothetical protein [Tateyamaria sp. SN3-11]|uniref:hypothetical protein n=1 Tax=Tateyamaria sp. SN3-11 TaxID=3092147 RepID=UPI0039EC5BAF
MAFFSRLALFSSSAAFAFTAALLALELSHAQLRTPVELRETERVAAMTPHVSTDTAMTVWPALFGEPQADLPPEAPIAAATNYTLSGLVIGDQQSWAMVSDGQTTSLVRSGQTLSGGETVLQIETEGVRIDRNGNVLMIGFSDDIQGQATARISPDVIDSQRADLTTEFDLSTFNRSDFLRVLGRAGGVERVTRDEGPPVIDILWVRPGQLYDRIGLQKNDTVVSINGVSAGDVSALTALSNTILDGSEIVFEIVRAGAPRTLRVALSNEN